MIFNGKDKLLEEKKIIDTIRCLGIDMINEAGSGHPGILLGAAPILYTLYAKHLKVNPADPKWYNRDRFVLSAGHGSALLYATLFMSGYDLSTNDLKNFRKLNSKTPGHPEYNVTPGVDMSTGPLGEGFASSVGMAIAEEYLRHYYLKKNLPFINYHTYVLCSDGDFMEGVSYEAASIAGNLRLSHLIAIYDCNYVTLDGRSDKTFIENVAVRFRAMNWNVIYVNDVENLRSLDNAFNKAKSYNDKPTLIIVNTTIGKYSKLEGSNKVHGTPLENDDILSIKERLGIRNIPFAVSQEITDLMKVMIKERVKPLYQKSKIIEETLTKEDYEELMNLLKNNTKIICDDIDYEIPQDGKESLRDTNGKILNQFAKISPFFMGGSPDTSTSTRTYLEGAGDFSASDRSGKNIWFGVREHAMAAILNGLVLSGFRVFGSTFLTFSDNMRPSIRMSALMKLPVTYIFTHDSISIGEDGPTHQPVEQLVSLRSIPNVEVFRPCDVNEIIGTYQYVMSKTESPSIISIGRNVVNIKGNTSINEVVKGGYIIKDATKNLTGIIISSGEEVDIALEVSKLLEEKGFGLRVVSMPSIELFKKQSEEYKNKLLPIGIKTFVIEASSSYSWNSFVYNDKYLITVDQFGVSASKDDIYKKFGFDINSIVSKIENLLK